MTPESTAIASVLLKNHREFCREFEGLMPEEISDGMVEQSVIPYGDLCEWAGFPFLLPGVGRFLDEIGEWCEENDWPLLNSLAVNRKSRMPDGSDLLLWPDQVRRCIAFDGYPTKIRSAGTLGAKRLPWV